VSSSSSDYHEPGPRPQIVGITAPSTVECTPECSGGACPLTIGVSFSLPPDQFVKQGLVRFQRDGSDIGVDRPYNIEPVYGVDLPGSVSATLSATVPANLVGTGSLFTYSVRLVTGAGEVSEATTLNLTVTSIPSKCDPTQTPGGVVDAGVASP
jgi:hypothetical protein